jgi:hypothetical protein
MLATGAHMSHFGAMVLFALCVSVAFACTGRHTARERIRYAIISLAFFLAIGVGVAWLMYPFSR